MLFKLACVVLVLAGCAEQTSETTSGLMCDVGGAGAFGNACVKASEPLAIDASPLAASDARVIVADGRAYGVRLAPAGAANAGKVRFVPSRTGTFQIYLGTPNIPFRIRQGGEIVTPGCTSRIAAVECAALRKVMSVALVEAQPVELEIGPTDLRYVRLHVQSNVEAPVTCAAEALVEPAEACEAANDGATAIDAGPLARSVDSAPALAVDEVYGVRLSRVATVAGATMSGGVVKLAPPVDGDYELYLGTPNIPVRIHGDLPSAPVAQVCSRYIPATECNLLRRGTRLTLSAGSTYWLELGPGPNTYVRVALRHVEPADSVHLDAGTSYPSANATSYLAGGDLDGDGDLDLVASAPDDAAGDTFLVPIENTGSAFVARTPTLTSAPAEAVIADFNGDGIADVAALAFDGQGPLPATYLEGEGAFSYTRSTWGSGRDFGRFLGAGDLDEDGVPELVAAWADLQSTGGSGGFVTVDPPGFGELQSEPAYGRDTSAAVAGDFDGDGHQDVIAASRAEATVRLYLGDGTGAVGFASEAPVGNPTSQLGAFDLDGDGATDLVAVSSQGLSIAYGQATGLAAPEIVAGDFTRGIAAGDFDHDGHLDLAAGMIGGIGIYAWTASGYVQARFIPLANVGQTFVAADLDGDGDDDLAVPTFDSITVFRSTP